MEEKQQQRQQQQQLAAPARPPLLRVKSPPPGLLKVHLVGASGTLASNVGLCAWLWEGSLYGWAAGSLGYSTESFQLMLGLTRIYVFLSVEQAAFSLKILPQFLPPK